VPTKLPLWVRKFVVDFVETGLAVLLALNLVVPGSLDEAKAEAAIVGSAILSALISAARRTAPDFIAWLRAQLAVSDG
jgi:hypothetical protein